MVQYYYESRGKIVGPYSIDEIALKKLDPVTLMWRIGLADWTPAHQIEDLATVFKYQPPPLPASVIIKNTTARERRPVKPAKPVSADPPVYDVRYKKDLEASAAGVFLICAPLLFIAQYRQSFATSDYASYLQIICIVGAIVIRSVATAWVIKIARKQNRDSFVWGTCSVIIPGITLIIIGLQKKLYDAREWRRYLYNESCLTAPTLFQKTIPRNR